MEKRLFTIRGNKCGERVRLGRHMHKPPLTQQQLAIKIQTQMGLEITKTILSRIENGERHVIDVELQVLAKALGVSMAWLMEETDDPKRT